MIDVLRHIDHLLFRWINSVAVADWLDPVMILLSSRFVWIPVYVLFIGLFIYKYRKQSWVVILLAIIVVSLSDSVSSGLIKPRIERVRPNHAPDLAVRMPNPDDGHGYYGFVSSHAANSFAIFLFAGLFLGMSKKNLALMMLIPALISYSRIYLGVHYPADVLGGALVGVVFAWLAWRIYGRCILWLKIR